MKLSCEKTELVRGVAKVQNVVSTKSTLPILANVLVETNGKKLRLVATDLEVGVECSVACDIESGGTLTVPAKRFAEIARELPDGKVSIEAEEGSRLRIAAGKVTYVIHGLPKDEFPAVPEVKGEQELALKAGDLRRMIQKTIFAVSADVTRYTLNGVYWWMQGGELRLVSTDGHRLCLIRHALAKKREAEFGAIVPTKALEELVRLCEIDADGEVRVGFAKSHLVAELRNTTLLSRLIEGKFPNYEQVIPKESEKKMRCGTDRLLRAVRRASLLAADRTFPVRIELSAGKLSASAQTPEVGEAREEIEVSYDGKELALALNARYVLDVLKNVEGEEITMDATDATHPVVFRSASDPDYTAVVMPMRV